MPFHGRQPELEALDSTYSHAGGCLAIVYGRRGVGKTALLRHWLDTRRHGALWLTAVPGMPVDQLRAFSQAVYAFSSPHRSPPADFAYRDWDEALEQVAQLAERRRLVLVVDEFTDWLENEPALPSILQRIWDHRLKETQLFLALIGSHSHWMRYDVLSCHAPLYGRARFIAQLKPLLFGALFSFFPDYAAAERVALYACLGGMPCYLSQWDPCCPTHDNLKA